MQLERSSEALALLERTKALLARWSTLLFCLLSLLSQGCSERPTAENPDSPAAPGGNLLFEELLAKHASSSQRRFRRLESVDPETTTIVSMGAELSEHEWGVLSSWVLEGGALVVIDPTQDFAESFDVQVSRTKCAGELLTDGYKVTPTGEWQAFDHLEEDERYFVCADHAIIAGMEWGQGWVTLIAAPELLQNAHLAEAEHAALIIDSIMIDGAQLELLGPWTGKGATSPLQSLIQGEFGWWVLHTLLFFIVAGWGLGRRFGRPSDPPRAHRRAFREHALALAAQYQRVGAHGFALRRFAEWSSEQLRRSGASGAKLRQDLNREFTEALASAESPGALAPSLNKSTSTALSIFRKLRDVPGRRLKGSSARSST